MEFSFLDWRRNEGVFVAVVLAVILAVSMFQLRVGEMKTRDAQRKADVELVSRALERYFGDYGEYPREHEGKIKFCGDKGLAACEWGEGKMVDVDNVVYLQRVPQDPLASEGWRYVYETDGGGFKIYVGLEYGRDKDAKSGLTRECGNGVECKWYVEK